MLVRSVVDELFNLLCQLQTEYHINSGSLEGVKYALLQNGKLHDLTEKIFQSALLLPVEATHSFASFLASLYPLFAARSLNCGPNKMA